MVERSVASGIPFMTNGCPGAGGEPGCTRPYGSYRPSEPIRDFPFLPDADDLAGIRSDLALRLTLEHLRRGPAMRIVVPIKQVPDLVEELELNDDGTDVDREFLKFVLSEWDDQALEEALLVKEAAGGEVVVVGFGDPDVELSLYTALAKGADRAVNLTGLGEGWIDSHTRAAALAEWLSGQEADLVLAGVQAVDDLDGQLPAAARPDARAGPTSAWSSPSRARTTPSRSARSSAAASRPASR